MRKAQTERPREARDQPEYRDFLGWFGPAPWLGMSGLAWKEGIKWLELWQREFQRLWGPGAMVTGTFGSMYGLGQPARPEGDRRRVSDMPWVPRLEAQVIPLRRNTDPPGGEATRFSMRLPLPWADGGANIVSIETILGAGEGGEREQGGAGPSGQMENSPGVKRG